MSSKGHFVDNHSSVFSLVKLLRDTPVHVTSKHNIGIPNGDHDLNLHDRS